MKTIKTVGTGELTLKPDVVRLYMTVTGVAGDYEETVRMSEERSEALRDCFSEVGFERDDLKTVGFNVNTKYENRRDGGSGDYVRVFAGYEFVHELRIEFDAEREKLSCVLGALSRCSAVPEFRLEYSVRDREAAKARLLDLAVADSRTRAERLARAVGIKGALSAQTIDCAGEVPELSVRPVGNMMLAKCCGCIDAGITPEDITVSDTVTVVWQAAD